MTGSEKVFISTLSTFIEWKLTNFMVSAVLSWAPCSCAANNEIPFCHSSKNEREILKYEGLYVLCSEQLHTATLVESASGGFPTGGSERAVVESGKCQFSRR